MTQQPRKYNVKPKSDEYYLIKEIKKQYGTWKANKSKRGTVEVLVTRDQYTKLWIDSGLWDQRGLAIGQATIYTISSLNVISIEDCKVLLRTKEIQSETYKGMPLGTKIDPDSPKILDSKKRKTQQYIGSVTKPYSKREVNRPKRINKPYIKSEKQMIKELNKPPAKRAPYKMKAKELELNIAVEMFYEASTNPLNAKIRELAEVKPTNYEVINLLTGHRAAFRPRKVQS